MMKLEFINNEKRVEFVIDHCKYVVRPNEPEFWCIRSSLLCAADKKTISDYEEENGFVNKFLIDGHPFGKNDEIVFVSHNYSIEEDSKLGVKSLLLRYLKSKIDNLLFSDELLSLNTMFELISDSISDDVIKFRADDMNSKSLSKLLTPFILKDTLPINSNDMSYEEIILFQLSLIKQSINENKRCFLYVELIYLTDRIIEYIEKIEGCIVVSIVLNGEKVIKKDNLFINSIDFENDEELYERMMYMSNYTDIKLYKEHLKEQLKKISCS